MRLRLRPSRLRAARRFRTSAIASVSIAAAAIVLSFRPIYEPDLWWHLAQGREDVAERLVRTNVFSFNYADYRQHYTTWLFDASAYLAWKAGGAFAVQALQASLIGLTLALLYGACRSRAPAVGASPAAAMLIVGFFVLEPRAIPRPHLASFAGMAACAWLVERAAARRSAAPLWWALPLIAVWSNIHVECVFGVMLIGLFALSELVRPCPSERSGARVEGRRRGPRVSRDRGVPGGHDGQSLRVGTAGVPV